MTAKPQSSKHQSSKHQSSKHQSSRPLFLALGTLAAVAALCLVLAWPSTIRPASSAASELSAERAIASLRSVLDSADGGPHPVGSAANRRVLVEIVRQLEAAGWAVEHQRGVGCSGLRTCAAVDNLIAKLPGQGSGPAVVVSSHTDSVPAAPGAGDDGTGVAVMLELARNLAAAPPLARPVWLLFNEGEEMGLLGAELFVDRLEDPAAVGAVINLEARGTEGPPWLFEVSDGGAELIAAYARSVARPNTSSIAYSVYRRMPNDTDLTVYKRAGLPGLGMSFIDGGARYHTPRDDLEHLSAAAVQRIGENAVSLTRELASLDLPLPTSEAVFFDLASLVTIHWPAAATLPLAALGLLLLFIAMRRSSPEAPLRALAFGVGRWLAMLIGGCVGAYLVRTLLGAIGAVPMAFPQNLAWLTAAAAIASVAAVLLVAALLGAASGPARAWATFYGGLLVVCGLGLLTAALEPAASYPFVLATLVGGLVGLLSRRAAKNPDAGVGAGISAGVGSGVGGAALATALVLVVTLVPLVRALPVGLGASLGLIVSGLLTALAVAPVASLVPSSRRFFPGLVVLVLAIATAVLAAWQPAVTADSPKNLTLKTYVDAQTRESRVLFYSQGALPDQLTAVTGAVESFVIPEIDRTRPSVRIADPGLESVKLEVIERSGEHLRLHVRSPAESWALMFFLPEGTKLTAVEWPGLGERRSTDGVEFTRLHAVPAAGLEVELTGKLEGLLTVVDRGLGMPPEAQPFLDARPADMAPIGLGDTTEVWSRVDLAQLQAEPLAESQAEPEDLEHIQPGL